MCVFFFLIFCQGCLGSNMSNFSRTPMTVLNLDVVWQCNFHCYPHADKFASPRDEADSHTQWVDSSQSHLFRAVIAFKWHCPCPCLCTFGSLATTSVLFQQTFKNTTWCICVLLIILEEYQECEIIFKRSKWTE